LTHLNLGVNPFITFTLPEDATNLTTLFIFFNNQLTNVSLPAGLTKLETLDLSGNRLQSLDLPPNLITLTNLNLRNNQLTSLTIPADMQQLTGLFVDGNPLTTFAVSETAAATDLAGTVAVLRSQGVSVFIYPLTVQLVRPRQLIGAFQFGLTGPPGVYIIQQSVDLATWSKLTFTTNTLGGINITDPTAQSPLQKFYRAVLNNQ